jgi:FMN phosphatase YigB (HAD superfamily)
VTVSSCQKILCLDFDGVICDSIEESLLVAHNGFQIQRGRAENVVERIERIPSTLTRPFRKYRYLVRPAREYWLLMHLIESACDTITESIFSSQLEQFRKEVETFGPVFYRTRASFQYEYYETWLSLHKLYDEFSSVWPSLSETYEVYIVTDKNSSSVRTLLSHFSIQMAPERILARGEFDSKPGAVSRIAAERSKEILFVDDNPRTVSEVASTGVQSYLARWGYFGSRPAPVQGLSHLRELIH